MPSRRSLIGFATALAALHCLPAFAAGSSPEELPSLPPVGIWPVSFTDAAGRKVTLAKAPSRIIVGNYIANYLLVGGAGSLDLVVGMTKDHWESVRTGECRVFSKAYPKIAVIPSIGGYHDDILNTERIISLKPDVIVINRSQFTANSGRVELLERAGIRVIVIDYHSMTLTNHVLSTRIIGRITGQDVRAERLCREAIEGLTEIDRRIAALPESEKHRTCYMELGSLGPSQQGNSYNHTVLWGAILKRIEAGSIAENNPEPWGALTREFVLSRRPEIIIIGGSLWNNNHADQMAMGFTVPRDLALKRLETFLKRPLWQGLPAVKNRRFYGVDHGSLRSIIDWRFTEFLAKVFYPETFRDTDPERAIIATYREYLPEIDPSGTFTLSLDES
ncbi:ABC transporter substrate-binding protein [Sutterella sp.]|uniref:ABC transporter substrate-binding protein n=1 Tax=Sutterella sp. TaxID=1981025 RepID=UPI0026E00404|nr:ABC transporter substrate-binding protein [Sutterella sp.]MDO5530907.1 ABC transporter substrate-binding protein [Sutterella sp.]